MAAHSTLVFPISDVAKHLNTSLLWCLVSTAHRVRGCLRSVPRVHDGNTVSKRTDKNERAQQQRDY